MSSRGTVFYTDMNEHCYDETNIQDNGVFRLVFEIDNENVISWERDEIDGWIFDIKGDSDLAKVLRSATYKGNR